MSQMLNTGGYSKISRRFNGGSRGFRLNPKRFSVQRLKSRLVYLIRIVNRWKSSYGETFQSLKNGIMMMKRNNNSSSSSSSSSRRRLVVQVSSPSYSSHNCRKPNFYRSNSFYSEAIADCLEFIKRSSLSVDQKL